jgi:hypothetical protein
LRADGLFVGGVVGAAEAAGAQLGAVDAVAVEVDVRELALGADRGGLAAKAAGRHAGEADAGAEVRGREEVGEAGEAGVGVAASGTAGIAQLADA